MNTIKRDKEIKHLYLVEKKSLREIADLYGTTRQRIQQIKSRLGLPTVFRREAVMVTCQWCGAKFPDKTGRRKYCCLQCAANAKKKKKTQKEIEQEREKRRARSRRYYHEVLKKDPHWRDIVKKRNENRKKRKQGA